MHVTVQVLALHLRSTGPGIVHDNSTLVHLLMDAWPHLHGSSAGGMRTEKLQRIESPKWNPPVLTFQIERHGGTALGSTRAEMQHWEVDLDVGTAEQGRSTHRQIHAMAARWNHQSLAMELAEAHQKRERTREASLEKEAHRRFGQRCRPKWIPANCSRTKETAKGGHCPNTRK
jgi:hypothetical protein